MAARTQPLAERITVTGSTGAIGKPLCTHLRERGHFVRGFARRPSSGCDEYVTGDLVDGGAVRRAVEGMDAVNKVAKILKETAYRTRDRDSIGYTVARR